MLSKLILGVLAASTAAVNVKTEERTIIHPERRAQLEKIKVMATTWTAKAGRWAREAPGASAPVLGHLGDNKLNVAAAKERGEVVDFVARDEISDIPESFDSAKQWPKCAKLINDIRDQSNCGCCWAFAGAEAASDRMCIATDGDKSLPISAQDVCFNSNLNGCNGGQITTPWTYIRWRGAVSGGQYNNTGPFGNMGLCSNWGFGHCHHHGPQRDDPYPDEGAEGCKSDKSPPGPTKCDKTAKGDHTDFKADKYKFHGTTETASGEEKIQRMIMEGGPVETAFTVYSDFEDYAGGIYQRTTGKPAGGHAVKIVGWGVENGTKYWKIANSWNPYWGEKGFFRIVRGKNKCGIEDQVTGSPSGAKWTKASEEL
jgi:cathepsin B